MIHDLLESQSLLRVPFYHSKNEAFRWNWEVIRKFDVSAQDMTLHDFFVLLL